MFEKGNQLAKLGSGGKKGRSGPRKSTPKLVADALELNEAKLPEYLDKLQAITNNPVATVKEQMECIFYLINRSQGTAKSQTDLRIKAQVISWTGDDYALQGLISEREKTFIENYTPKELSNATEQEEEQGTDEVKQVAQGNFTTEGDETRATRNG